MVEFPQLPRGWRIPALSLAVLLLVSATGTAQGGHENHDGMAVQNQDGHNSKPMPLKPATPGTGRNLRVILKDGSYQLVRDYQIAGDRVRYLSQERGEWEELPADLVDWDATNKWAKDHAQLVGEDSSPAMKEAADIDAEESDERNDEKAR